MSRKTMDGNTLARASESRQTATTPSWSSCRSKIRGTYKQRRPAYAQREQSAEAQGLQIALRYLGDLRAPPHQLLSGIGNRQQKGRRTGHPSQVSRQRIEVQLPNSRDPAFGQHAGRKPLVGDIRPRHQRKPSVKALRESRLSASDRAVSISSRSQHLLSLPDPDVATV